MIPRPGGQRPQKSVLKLLPQTGYFVQQFGGFGTGGVLGQGFLRGAFGAARVPAFVQRPGGQQRHALLLLPENGG